MEHVNVEFMTPLMWIWAIIVCLCFVISPFVTKSTWRSYTVGALAIVCIPSLTSLYAWAFMLVPLSMICRTGEKNLRTWIYFAFMAIPFAFIPLRIHYAITNNGLMLYFCTAILSGIAVFDTFRDLVILIRDNHRAGITFKQYFKSLITVK